MLVTLNEKEQAYCQKIGADRYNLSRQQGLKQLRIDVSTLDVEALGVEGEFVFAKVFGFNYPTAEGADGGVDFQEGDLTIDVKAASREYYNLIFRSLESFKSGYAVLVVKVSDNSFKIVGMISQEDFKEICKPLPSKPSNSVVYQKDLYSLKILWDEIGKRRFND
jgi:hypothetical protein